MSIFFLLPNIRLISLTLIIRRMLSFKEIEAVIFHAIQKVIHTYRR